MERAGKEDGKGSITAFFTVLVEGDDMSDPIADQSRSILDGHIVLSREFTDQGIYPPIHILNSASRVMNDVITTQHLQAALRFKRLYALLKENEMLIRIGAYQKGNDDELDLAMDKKEEMEELMKQASSECIPMPNALDNLMRVMS
jgi:flagellum-specific ATP synthase